MADTHGIPKYARTCIWDTHTHAHIKKYKGRKTRKNKVAKITRKKRGGQERTKEGEKQERTKKKEVKRRRKMRKKRGGAEKRKKKRKKRGDGFRGGRGACVLRRAGPHTNNARST